MMVIPKSNKSVQRLKIPINVSVDPLNYDYSVMFKYIKMYGFIPEPYLSSSSHSLRAGQNNWKNFCNYGMLFFGMKEENLLPGFIHLVFNARSKTDAMEVEIAETVNFLIDVIGFKKYDLNLILNDPWLVSEYIKKGFNVTVSSASISSYKHIIDLLINKDIFAISERLSYVLPSTYQHTISFLPINSFEILLNNGCMLGCRNGGISTDHTKFCPSVRFSKSLGEIKFREDFYNDPFQELTDIILYWKFMKLRSDGWKEFKISGRQADPNRIFDVVKYYLRDDSVPYIDSPISYGKSSNG